MPTQLKSKPRTTSVDVAQPGLDSLHPVCRGDFAAIVFSGRSIDLGELPGEPTAQAIYKFALVDPRWDASEDFARSPGMPLPLWSNNRLEPTPGVCFVLGDPDHPAIKTLRSLDARQDQHYVVIDSSRTTSSDDRLLSRLAILARDLSLDSDIALLGYGHQGQIIAGLLCDEFGISRDRLRVWDSNDDSRRLAAQHRLIVAAHRREILESSAVIYTPLMRHQGLHRLLDEAAAGGVPVFDNSHQTSGLKHFTTHGRVLLDAAAEGAAVVTGTQVCARNHQLPLICQVIREDRRRLAGVEFPDLHGGHFIPLRDDQPIELDKPDPGDVLASITWASMQRAFVSVRPRADTGYFAARDLGQRFWAGATSVVFPSDHVIDLGATAFERLLYGHLVGREIVSTMQTPTQRAILGIAARQFAADRPIIEIGSAFGGSALLMAAATDEYRPPVYSIDPEASTRDIMRFAFEREGHLERLHQVVQTSDDAIDDLQHLCGAAGVVFIDGCHTQQAVIDDINNYSPLAAVGGALILHDVCPQIYSVLRVVIERLFNDQGFELKCLVDGLAIFERLP